VSIFVVDPPEDSIFLPSAIGSGSWFFGPSWLSTIPASSLIPETVSVDPAPEPTIRTAQALDVAPAALSYTATAAELGVDPTTITSAAFFVQYPDGTTSQWPATSTADANQITATHLYADGDLPEAARLRVCAVWGLGGTGGTLTTGGDTLTTGGNPLSDGSAGGVIRSRGFALLVLD
jgi:hypothetical protein